MTELKQLAHRLERPHGSTTFPWVIVFLQNFDPNDFESDWVGSSEVQMPSPPSREYGWYVEQVLICGDNWENIIATVDTILTQAGVTKGYKNLNPVHREFQRIFGPDAFIQFRFLTGGTNSE